MQKIKKTLLFSLLLSIGFSDFAQSTDTLRVMAYNLLFYRQTTSFCPATVNNTTVKDNAMEDIIDHVVPDILVVNEMGGGSAVNAFRLLQNALNQNGRSFYSMANSTGIGNSLVNMLYYNNQKLVLESQTTIDKDLNNNNLVRLIDVYTLYYNSPNLASSLDTTRIHVLAAHLKAGSTSSNQAERARATEAVMAYLDSNNATGNYIMAGDFNLARSTEAAYQDLINYVDPTLRFFDPVNVAGSWSNNSIFAALHTQSTHTSGGCFAGGGMDDRFDFILISDEIRNNTDDVRYIPNTYQALGQDGLRFNQTIISPTNNSVPSVVSQALFNMSDHLPVIMDMEVSISGALSLAKTNPISKLKFANPTSGQLLIDLSNQKTQIKEVQILSITGKLIDLKRIDTESYLEFDLQDLPNGTYFIKVINQGYQQKVEKLIKI